MARGSVRSCRSCLPTLAFGPKRPKDSTRPRYERRAPCLLTEYFGEDLTFTFTHLKKPLYVFETRCTVSAHISAKEGNLS